MDQDQDFDQPQRAGDFDPGERPPYGEGPADSDERHEYGGQGDYGADQPGGESFGRRRDDASQQDDYAGPQSASATDQLDSASEKRPGYRGRQQDYGQESGSVRGDTDYDSRDIGGQAGESESF